SWPRTHCGARVSITVAAAASRRPARRRGPNDLSSVISTSVRPALDARGRRAVTHARRNHFESAPGPLLDSLLEARDMLCWILTLATLGSLETQMCARGVIVEEVAKGFAAAQAGLAPGDVLCAWERTPGPSDPDGRHGTVVSPFDLDEVEREESSRGSVTLAVSRAGVPLQVRVAPGE